jgi:F0F1-type ATP synthase epsilon subunit
MQKAQLTLTVKNRDGIIFSGDIVSMTSYNDKGKFDILSRHANFISLIKNEIEYRLPGSTANKIEIDNGILRVIDNKIDIYLGIGRSPSV